MLQLLFLGFLVEFNIISIYVSVTILGEFLQRNETSIYVV